jgi:glyoxylase-like metal-dependent hydrolase (beta-lactamase superfamily II)
VAAGPDRTIDYGDLSIGTFVTGSWRENCYLVTDHSASVTAVIDPGDEHERLIGTIEDRGYRVTLILLTHAHYDHVGAVVALSEYTGLACHVHHDDHKLLRRAPLYALSFENKKIPLPKSIELFDDGARFEFGARCFESIPCPGHTPGGTCFRLGNLLFVGDTILVGKRGRTDLPGGDAEALEESITGLLGGVEGDFALFPGHGEPWTLEEARRWWAAEGARKSR